MWPCKRYKESFYQSKGGTLVLIWIGLVLMSTLMIAYSSQFILQNNTKKWIVEYSVVAVIYAFYPLFGYLGERIPRHKVLLCGTVITMTGYIMNLALIFSLDIRNELASENHLLYFVCRCVANFCGFLGYGVCYSNFLQFGITQLEFAPSTVIKAYVRWFTFTSLTTGIFPPLFAAQLFKSMDSILIINGIYLMIMIIILAIVYSMRRHITLESLARLDAVTLIYRVLKYAWKHDSPQRPSAYSYSYGPPSRLDFAKSVFGGPFTTQQVEDVKSFGYLLLIPLCHIISPGMFVPSSLAVFYMKSGCIGTEITDTLEGIVLKSTNSLIMLVAVSLIGVIQMVIAPWCHRSWSLKIITRMWVALFFYLLSGITSSVMSYDVTSKLETIEIPHTNATVHICQKSLVWPYPVILVPVILSGMGLGLSIMSQLEFIMAQAPHTMKGILVGITYLQFLTSFLVSFFGSLTIIGMSMCFYFSITVIQAVILIMYSIVAKYYKYRQQDDESVLNLRDTIVDIYEKELREREIADGNSRFSIYSSQSTYNSSID